VKRDRPEGAGVNREADLAAIARAIIGSNLYMVLGTADDQGRPWVSPVYFAPAAYTNFYWVSSPEARHSRNLAVRPELSIVIFDSGAPISMGQAVYMSATAQELTDIDEIGHGIAVFSERTLAHGGKPWGIDDVRGSATLRLYRATASEQWILEPGAPTDRRVAVRTSPTP
jgi:nitroimidazol reductase NimA-like FMN-containing flavoprotein (pyridoxamine 5'-phosphate oxidase superfamily)